MSKLIVSAESLNVRTEPDIQSAIIGHLSKGQVIDTFGGSPNGYWQKVKFGLKFGWVSFKYLQPLMEDSQVSVFPWMQIALKELGISEVKGAESSARILDYLRSTTLRGTNMADTDETPWCSAFVNFCVEQAGYAGTDSAMARSWLNWGCAPEGAPPAGSIVIFKRGEPPQGHVAFYVSKIKDQIRVLGGNQSDSVCYRTFPESDVLGFRIPS